MTTHRKSVWRTKTQTEAEDTIEKPLALPFLVLVFPAFLILLTSFAPYAVAQTQPEDANGLNGVWIRVPDESDDAEAKMQAAMESMRERMQARRGSGGFGGGGPRGGGGGRPGMGERGRGGGPGGPGMGRGIPAEITLSHESTELHIDDGERLRIYYLDGEKHKREMPNGTELETVSEIRGLSVYIEEKMRRGGLSHEYELAPDGNLLVHTLTMKMAGMKEPVVIRTVYERDAAR